MKLDKYKNFIFDFDGTIANSNPLHEKSFKKALFQIDKIKSKKFKYANYVGNSTKAVYKKLGFNNKDIKKLVKLKQSYYKKNIKKVFFFKNVIELLKLLKEKKKKLFLVTGSRRTNIIYLIKKNKIKFNGIITAESTLKMKPDPSPYKLCLTKFKISRNESLAIEDSISGIVSAQKNKIMTVGINNNKIKKKTKFYFKNFKFFYKYLKND